MASTILTSLAARSSLSCLSFSSNLKRSPSHLLRRPRSILLRSGCSRLGQFPRRLCSVCFFNAGNESEGEPKKPLESGLEWAILKRWEVPWQWQTVSLTSLACGLSFVLTGLVEIAALPYLGIKIEELSLDEKAEMLFLDQSITTAVVLAVLYGITNSFQPVPDDVFRYDLRDPFNLQKGWILWAGIGLFGALLAIALTGVAMSALNGETSQRETDALVRLLPLIGSSSTSTACLVAITGILAPVLEETVFRGFFMVALTKWYVPSDCLLLSYIINFNLSY
uniref:Uncharacterized protein MANES_05G100900 n=2 Tax=Rhizophora mucronata TaxID=61149 RepID=A0A2P2LSC4_RHIMU